MARTITDPDAAATFARVIASDLSLYNEAVLVQGLRDGRPFAGLEDELVEARVLFLERVPPPLDPIPLLVRTLADFFTRWASDRGLPTDGLPHALATRLAPLTESLALVVRAGLQSLGRAIPLASGVSILGRDGESDIELPAATIARRHAQLTVTGTPAGPQVEVEDLDSPTGTWVNGEIIRGATPLSPGDILQVGTVALELVRSG